MAEKQLICMHCCQALGSKFHAATSKFLAFKDKGGLFKPTHSVISVRKNREMRHQNAGVYWWESSTMYRLVIQHNLLIYHSSFSKIYIMNRFGQNIFGKLGKAKKIIVLRRTPKTMRRDAFYSAINGTCARHFSFYFSKGQIYHFSQKRSIKRSIKKGGQMVPCSHPRKRCNARNNTIATIAYYLMYILQTFEKTHQTVLR